MKKVICLVGESGAGKGVISGLLEQLGYTTLSLSSEVRVLAKEIGLENASRAELQIMANKAREQEGAHYFAQRVVDNPSFTSSNYLVVDGVRHPSELELIRSQAGLSTKIVVLAVTAGVETRFKRVLERRDPSDPVTFEQFLDNDLREKGGENSEFTQQNEACIAMADFSIANEGTVDELKAELLNFLYMKSLHPEGQVNRGKERK